MTAGEALAEFERQIEIQGRITGIHYALMIYTLEQLGFEDVFQRCFSYVGGTLILWDIYRTAPPNLSDFLVETFNTLPWPYSLEVGEETYEAIKDVFPCPPRQQKPWPHHIGHPFGLNIVLTPGIPPGEIHFMQVIGKGEDRRLEVFKIVNVEIAE